MRYIDKFEFPDELKGDQKKAIKLEWGTLIYLVSTALVVYLTQGNSQSMKTAFFEDLISMTPSISFLIANRFINRPASERFPYGFHRSVSIAYLCSAVSLLGIGLFLIYDASSTLIKREHPTIGTVVIFGHQVWLGYLMIMAMIYSTFPALWLGKKKLPLAKKIHDKNLYTDAKMNKADWMTAVAAIFGVIGIGLGWWWADALAAIIIASDIVHDGWKNIRQAVFDLMDEEPKTISQQKVDPLVEKVRLKLLEMEGIEDASVRLREEGHIYTGIGFIQMHSEDHMVERIEKATETIKNLDWRLHEFILMPVKEIKRLSSSPTR